MRRLTTMLAIGSALMYFPWQAAATTPGPVCRRACKPRVLEQCGELAGTERRRCRRPLIRACKTTTPAIACETTADLTRELADREIRVDDGSETRLTLCESGTFELSASAAPAGGGGLRVITNRSGTWEVRLVDGALALAFDDQAKGEPLPVAHDASGTLLVGGAPAEIDDAAAACAIQPDEPAPAPVDVDRVVSLTRAVTDRALVIDAPNGVLDERLEVLLCGSGRAVATTITDAGDITRSEDTWTIDGDGGLVLVGTDDSAGRFSIAIEDDGQVLIDDQPVEERDARAECRDADLADALTRALGGRAFFFVQQVGTIPVRTTLGLCDSGRYRLETTSAQDGIWRVRVVDGAATIAFEDGAGHPQPQRFATAFDADGGVTVQGTAPIDDLSIVDAACQS